MQVLLPKDENEAALLVATAAQLGQRLAIEAGATKRGCLRAPQADAVLSTRRLCGITLYSPQELVMSAWAGTPLATIREALAKKNQFLPPEPLEGAVYFADGVPTIGGAVAGNFSGPRRINCGAMRDHVLGMRYINGKGEILRAGGRVLKNVTGLDICKILAGSWGTLALISEVTFKILPQPQSSASVVVETIDAAAGVAFLSAALGSPFGVSGAAYLAGRGIAVARLEFGSDSITYRGSKLCALAEGFGEAQILGDNQSRALWAQVAAAQDISGGANQMLWQISLAPSAAPGLLMRLGAYAQNAVLDWGGGRVMVAGPATMEHHLKVVLAVKEAGGSWMVLKCPEDLRDRLEVMPAQPAVLARISNGLRKSFDPLGVFDTGRMGTVAA